MLLPVTIYLAFTGGTDAAKGWGIVMATDTAFALGVLAVAGRRASQRLRAFVLTVVIADETERVTALAGDPWRASFPEVAHTSRSLAWCRAA
jgi:NhaA family Na+:H+ antiporter